MKGLVLVSNLFLLILLPIVVSCDSDDVLRIEAQQQEPQECDKNEKCIKRMDWDLILAKEERPYKISVRINEAEVINDCKAGSRLSGLDRGPSVSTMVIENYNPITSDAKFKLEIYDLGSCYESKLYHLREVQPFKIRKTGNESRVWIEISN